MCYDFRITVEMEIKCGWALGNFHDIPGVDIASHYQPAEKVGGDWLLIAEDRDQKLLFLAVGDVTGHGLASAMLSSFVSGSLSSIIHSTSWRKDTLVTQLGQLVTTINELLYKKQPTTQRLMSMILLALERNSDQGYMINCGHPLPIVVTGTKAVRLDKAS